MFFKKKKKNFFTNKEYRRERRIRYKNPLKIKKGIFQFKVFRIINIFLIIGILGCFYFFIFSDFYNITNIEVWGNQIISTDDVLDITNNYLSKNRFFILKNKNIFLFSKNSLKEEISKTVILDNLVIEKILPNTIRLNVREKDPAFKWLTNNQQYLIDKQGMVIKRYYKLFTPKIFQLTELKGEEAPQQRDDLMIIRNLADQDINLGDHVISAEDIEFVFNLVDQLEQIEYLEISDVNVPNNFPEYLIIGISGGWQIYFNFADSIESQINRLEILIRDKIKKENLFGLDYIDLRLGESIYYKFK